ncbi:VanZ family protein [Arenimonas sp. MALMAid1274]|uniref:VanZ family protein n=1 Tax=Arenimonas sp. MALMAid1274 TaxID=3411630 RepID=UPI003BA097D5
MKRLRHLPLALCVLLVTAAALLPASMLKSLRGEHPWFSQLISRTERLWPSLDSVHVLMFVFVGMALALFAWRRRGLSRVAWPIAGVALLAAVGELVQFWVPGRTPLWSDFRDDLIGGSVGIAIVLAARSIWDRWVLPGAMSGWQRAALAFAVLGVVLLPMEGLRVLEIQGRGLHVADLAFIAGMMVITIRGIVAPEFPRWSASHAWVAACVLLLAVSCLVFAEATAGGGRWWGVAYLASLAVFFSLLARDYAALRAIAMAWLIGAALAAVVWLWALVSFHLATGEPATASHSFQGGWVPPGPYLSVQSLLGGAKGYCNYLLVSAGLLLVAVDQRWIRWRLAGPGLAALAIAMAALSTLFAVLGPLGVFVATYAWIRLRGQRPRTAAGAFGLGLLVMLAWIMGVVMKPVQAVPQDTPYYDDLLSTWFSVAVQAGVSVALALTVLCRTRVKGPIAASDEAARQTLALWLVMAFVLGGLSESFDTERHLWLLSGMLLSRLLVKVDSVQLGSPRTGGN